MKVCVLDAWSPDDPALADSHWIAERSADALRRRIPDVELSIVTGELDTAQVEAELTGVHDGFAYFGHGRERVLFLRCDGSGRPIALLGVEQVEHLRGRWFHAFACWSGTSLCWEAAHAGAAAYLGYELPVNLSFERSALPDEVLRLLEDLVTTATLHLAGGERSRNIIRGHVRAASDRLMEWLDTHDDVCFSIDWTELAALHSFAQLLHRRLELQGTDVVP